MPAESPTPAAALLTGALSLSLDPLDIQERLRVPAVVETTPSHRGPLDLNASVFVYRILATGRVVVVPPYGRACWSSHADVPASCTTARRVHLHSHRTSDWRRAR